MIRNKREKKEVLQVAEKALAKCGSRMLPYETVSDATARAKWLAVQAVETRRRAAITATWFLPNFTTSDDDPTIRMK